MQIFFFLFFSQNNLCVGLRSAILKPEVLHKFVKYYYSVDPNSTVCQQGHYVELIKVKINLKPCWSWAELKESLLVTRIPTLGGSVRPGECLRLYKARNVAVEACEILLFSFAFLRTLTNY